MVLRSIHGGGGAIPQVERSPAAARPADLAAGAQGPVAAGWQPADLLDSVGPGRDGKTGPRRPPLAALTRPAPAGVWVGRGSSTAKPPALPRTADLIGPGVTTTEGGTLIRAVSNDGYAPLTSPNEAIPQDPELLAYLRITDGGFAANFENTDFHALGRAVQTYARENPGVLGRLGIDPEGLDRLTPRQAILLSAQIAQDIETFNRSLTDRDADEQLSVRARLEGLAINQLGVEAFFRPGIDGVCRNTIEIVQGVFESLREMQDPATTQLRNIYCKLIDGGDHAWNAFYTVQPDGEVVVTQVDATMNDNDIPGGSHGVDYTFGDGGARDYHRQVALLVGTGNRSLRAFLERFDNGNGLFALRGSGTIGLSEVRAAARAEAPRAGSAAAQTAAAIEVLSRAIDALPGPNQVEAWHMLDEETQVALSEYRGRAGLDPVPIEHLGI